MKKEWKQLLKITNEWEAITGITGITGIAGSIIYSPIAGVAFSTGVFPGTKILDYYAMQGRKQYEKVQKIKKLRYHKTVLREVDFSISYNIEDKETIPNVDRLLVHYYTSYTSRTARSEKHQQIVKEMKEMIRYAARQISLDIYGFLLDLNIKPEKDNYLVDLSNYK